MLKIKTRPSEREMADDLLEGAVRIAEHTGKTERQIRYLLEYKKLPAFKLGGVWHMRKSAYQAFIERLEASAIKAAG